MKQITGNKLLVKALKEEGVEYLFGYPGACTIDISDELSNGYFDAEAQAVAGKVAELIRRSVPDYLLGEWRFFNNIAGLPLCDGVVESLIEKGILTPPDNGIGAEGCWMGVSK